MGLCLCIFTDASTIWIPTVTPKNGFIRLGARILNTKIANLFKFGFQMFGLDLS